MNMLTKTEFHVVHTIKKNSHRSDQLTLRINFMNFGIREYYLKN